ncbi:MAG: hypothetical protein M3Q44_08070 [bacterium]|nr:hypothetical protein [bacterium]
MDKKHLLIVVFAVIFTSVVLIGLRVPIFNLSQLSRNDSGSAQSCAGQNYAITQPTGHVFAKQCTQSGGLIYSNDSRFTFFDVPGGQLPTGFSYVQTNNVNAKNDRNLNWSITLQADSMVYVYYRRRIAITAPPSWLDSNFTSNTAATPIDINALNNYLLRKNNANNKIGVYDIYFAERSSGSVLNFGPASEGNNSALSMYLVSVIPVRNPPSPSSSPTCAPGIDCGNDGGTATPIPTTNPTATPIRTPSPSAAQTAIPSADPTAGSSATPAPGARETSVYLQTQNNSGQSGYAIITELSPTRTRVSLSLFGGNYTNQPAHIHSGTCANPGPVIYPLLNVDGISITYLDLPYTTVVSSLGLVNIHKSVAESNVYTACGTP